MCFDKLSSICNFNTSGVCCKGLLEDDKNIQRAKEINKIISLLHIEICGVCGRETLNIDILGAQKRCMNCLGIFRNRRAE